MGEISIVLNARNIRELEDETTGTTRIAFTYKKQDPRVAKLVVILKDTDENILDSTELDVSNLAEGNTQDYDISLNNNLANSEVVPDNISSITVSANSEATYTPPSGYDAVVLGEDAGIRVVEIPDTWNDNIVVLNGETITLQNTQSTSITVKVYEFVEGTIQTTTLILEFRELDGADNILHQNSISILEIPPLTINESGGGGSI